MSPRAAVSLLAQSDRNSSWDLLVRTASSLKTGDKPIDLKAMQETIRKGSAQ